MSRFSALLAVAIGMWLAVVRYASVDTTAFQTIGSGQPIAAVASVRASTASETIRTYCVKCHNQRLLTAGLTLEGVNGDDIAARPELWERVLRKLETREMPPRGLPRPDDATTGLLIEWLEDSLARVATEHPNFGRVPLHRLSRAQYVNAIDDLLNLKVDGDSLLLADDLDRHGFDNNAGVLSVSPVLLERYLAAARKISRLATGDLTIVPGFETYAVPKLMLQDERMSVDLPFGSRGGLAIRHMFPLDAEYIVRIRLRRQLYDYIQGLGEPHQLDVRLDDALVGRLTIGGEGKGRSAPATFAGNIQGDPEWELYMHYADSKLEVRFAATAGHHVVGVSFVETPFEPEGVLQPEARGFARAVDQLYDGNPAVHGVMIGGPYNVRDSGDTPSRRRIFSCRPKDQADERPCASRILSAIARRAYRRPVTKSDLDVLMEFYDSGRHAGGFEGGVRRGLERILVAPDFLFRIERDPQNIAPSTPYRLADLELASRLSFFLWNSIPDDELLETAARGRLKDPVVLEREVRRLLADPRAEALATSFVGRWLGVRKLAGVIPDPAIFPNFDENLRAAFEQETELFVKSQLTEDRSVTDLFAADYTFVNERLARHYGIPTVYGSHFRRVKPPGERAGLLGHGSVLTVTSYPNRTSPVLRGHWVLENILGTPPPPPPPDVPALPERTGSSGKNISMRERMEQHRSNPACTGCHVRMDPIGFSLENFDAIGKWRTTADGTDVDASGALPDGRRFEGLQGLRQIILQNPETVARTLTEKLLAYAIGRNVEYSDLPTVRRITHEAGSTGYRWSSIILGIVNSGPFQMRRSES